MMSAPLFNGPRNWKWMVPAILIAPCFIWWGYWVVKGGVWEQLALIPLALTFIFTIAALLNAFLYAQARWSEIYADVQSVRNSTPEVRMFEAAKNMHPEAVKALLVHRRSIWRIKYVPLGDVVDWIFDELPTVHAGFVDFVLDKSNQSSLMSKRLLSDGSKQFDPEELVTDYQQYDDLMHYMQAKLMCTQAYGNQAPKWLPPWSPDLARHRFGLDGAPYAVEEEGLSEAMQAVMRAQAQWQSNNGLKDLGQEELRKRSESTKQIVPVNGNGHKADASTAVAASDLRTSGQREEEPDLTDKDMEAIQAETTRNASQYRS